MVAVLSIGRSGWDVVLEGTSVILVLRTMQNQHLQ